MFDSREAHQFEEASLALAFSLSAHNAIQTRQNAQVAADHARVANGQTFLFFERRQRRQAEHPASNIADQAGRQVKQQFVDQTGINQGSVESPAPFDVQFVDAAPSEFL